jgi:hypothetical protein
MFVAEKKNKHYILNLSECVRVDAQARVRVYARARV